MARAKRVSSQGITLLGLGPGDPQLLTRRAWELLETASEVYLRTQQHPVVAGLPGGLQLHSFDDYYENGQSFEAVYQGIIARVLELGRRPQGVIYAVPGHPFVAEATSPEIARQARALGIPMRLVEGVSFIEPVLAALNMDLLPHTAIVDGLKIAAAHVPPFPPSAPAIIAQIHSRLIASEVKQTLSAVYPDSHPVYLVHAAGTPDVTLESLPLFEIDRGSSTGLLTALYVPPLSPKASFEAFQELIAHLRAPDGCPWDRQQDHQTLRPHLLEETYEVLSALDANDPLAMREEFGDLLLQIVLHAQIASEYGEFGMAEILESIHNKIVQRHPHVFGELELEDAGKVLRNWERLKEAERASQGKEAAGLLEGVPRALPALAQAEEYQRRAGRVGFDWPDIQGVQAKLKEELNELHAASDQSGRSVEIGDLLFSVVNLARWYGLDAESALRQANARFKARFALVEEAARQQGRLLSELTLDEMEAIWQAAKGAGSAVEPG